MHKTAVSLNQLADELKAAFHERDDAIDALILAILSGHHAMLLGDPGVAKTNLVKHLLSAITGARKFFGQTTKNTPAEKIIGPIDLLRFREHGEYVHKREGYTTAVELSFIDEIGKASAVLGHELLTLLADRQFHEVSNGLSIHDAPLHCMLSASNEIPTHESDAAAAMYDRFLIRVLVEDIKDDRAFLALLTQDVPEPTVRIEFDDIKKVTEVELAQIELSPEAGQALVELRRKLSGLGVDLSARRYRWSMKVLQAAAFMAGSDKVYPEHLIALRHTLWDEYEQREVVFQAAAQAANPFFEDLQTQMNLMGEIEKEFRDRAGNTQQLQLIGADSVRKLGTVREALDELIRSGGDTIPGLAKVADRHRELLIRAFVECMEQDPDVAELSASKRLGLGGFSTVEVA